MGSVTVLYAKPKQYARFLGTELGFVYKGRLLVVMANGYGVSRKGKALPREQAVADRLGAPGKSGAALAEAGTKAVTRLAADAGVVVPVPSLAAGGRSAPGSTTTRDRATIAVAALVALLLAAGLLLYRRRRA
jgi:hypothetical protein